MIAPSTVLSMGMETWAVSVPMAEVIRRVSGADDRSYVVVVICEVKLESFRGTLPINSMVSEEFMLTT